VFKSEQGKQLILESYRSLLAQWPVANKQYVVDTGLGKTFVIESGDSHKPPLVLLHGSVSNSFTWMGDVLRYAEDYRVFAVDIVGEPGLSAESRPDYDSGEYALWLNDVLGALQLESVALVGLSLGGWMALDFATRFPEKVYRLALICPGGLGPERASFIPKAIFYSLLGRWGRRKLTELLNAGPLPDSPELRKAMDITLIMGRHFRPRTARLPIFTAQQLARLAMPVLVLFGGKDALIDGAQSLRYARANLSDGEVVELLDSGHLILNQADRIASFLTR